MVESKTALAKPAPIWRGASDAMPALESSWLASADTPTQLGDRLTTRTVEGDHTTLDSLADGVAPTAPAVGGPVASAEGDLQASAAQLSETRDPWSEGLRTAVRNRPLTALVGGLAVGALIARIIR